MKYQEREKAKVKERGSEGYIYLTVGDEGKSGIPPRI